MLRTNYLSNRTTYKTDTSIISSFIEVLRYTPGVQNGWEDDLQPLDYLSFNLDSTAVFRDVQVSGNTFYFYETTNMTLYSVSTNFTYTEAYFDYKSV